MTPIAPRWCAAAFVFLFGFIGYASTAQASGEGVGDLARRLADAEAQEARGEFREALRAYEGVAAVAPGRWASRARARIEWLNARSEGDFVPLRLSSGLRSRGLASSDDIKALLALAASFPEGRVRVESRHAAAEAAHALGDYELADAAYRALLSEATLDVPTRRVAAHRFVDLKLRQRQYRAAYALSQTYAADLPPEFVGKVARARWRGVWSGLAYVVTGATVVFFIVRRLRARQSAAPAAAKGSLARNVTIAAVTSGLVALGGVLARQHEGGRALPFLVLAGAVLPILLLAGSSRRPPGETARTRGMYGLMAGVTVLALSLLGLLWIDPALLEGFGL